MARRFDWTPPDEASTGEPFNIGAYVECAGSASCDRAVISLFLFTPYTDDPVPLFVSAWPGGPAGSATPINPGLYAPGYSDRHPTIDGFDWLRTGPSREFNIGSGTWSTLIIDRPGDYKLEMTGLGRLEHNFTVTDTASSRDVSVVCSVDAPPNPSPGDQVILRADVTNRSATAVTVDVDFTFGSATKTQSVSVPSNDSTTVSQPFNPSETGIYNPDISYQVV